MIALRRTWERSRSLLLAFSLLVIVYLVGVFWVKGFGGTPTIKAVLLLSTFLGIVTMGQTVVILIGGIDLSVPFLVGAANVAVAQLTAHGTPFGIACVIVLAGAAAIGALNALISVSCNVHPLIVTLGTGTTALGMVQWWTKGLPQGSAPHWLTKFDSIGSTVGPLPFAPVVLLWIGLAVGLLLVMRYTVFGRSVYALGNAPEAARFALISRLGIWIRAFGFSALTAAFAGILLLGFTGSAFAEVGNQYLFLSIGAVVIGGTTISGGEGGYLGTIIGVLTLTTLTTVFVGLGLQSATQQAVLGGVIIALVAVHGRSPHVRTRI